MNRLTILCAIAALLLVGCSPYQVKLHQEPLVAGPRDFSSESATASEEITPINWWEEYQDDALPKLVEEAFASNLTLQAAWSRLAQAQAGAVIAGSGQYPQVNFQAGASRVRLDNSAVSVGGSIRPAGRSYQNSFFMQSGLGFELDIWRRVASLRAAADYRVEASQADLENTRLVLTGSLVETWFELQEHERLLQVLSEQIKAGQTQLDLIELRFSLGNSSALAVYEQRQQLLTTEAEVPLVRARRDQLRNQLLVLLGKSPGSELGVTVNGELPKLPPFPLTLRPVDLLGTRPDLRAALFALQGSEYDVASAVAERFPRLSLSLSYDFRTGDLDDLFTQETGMAASELLLPFLDGGRRAAQVDRNEARRDELLALWSEGYLRALQEVESALIEERERKLLLENLRESTKNAEATLSESRSRYINGLADYLRVVVSLQTLQGLERQLVSAERALLVARARLYRAMGGAWKIPDKNLKMVSYELERN